MMQIKMNYTTELGPIRSAVATANLNKGLSTPLKLAIWSNLA